MQNADHSHSALKMIKTNTKVFLTAFHTVLTRGIIPFFLILITPFRILFDFFTITHPDFFRGSNNPFKHAQKVKHVQEQVQQWIRNGRKGRLCSNRPAWHSVHIRSINKSEMNKITLDLEDFVDIDVENKMLTVEPGMKIGTLTAKLLPLGWTIPVVPELETLTIGGLICGAGLETSSHKYGTFVETCVSFQLVLADGRCITCDENNNVDVLYALPMSYGTIGFLTAVKIPMIPAKRYVELEYVCTNSITEAKKLLEESKHEFVEGIMYGLNKIVIMYGNMVDGADPKKVKTFMKWNDVWFFRHVETFFGKPNNSVEYVPLRDYYHRHQRGLFWTVQGMMPYGNHPWFRNTLGWVMPINVQLGKLLRPNSKVMLDFIYETYVLQDFVVPMSKLEEVVALTHKEVEVYPLWLCPCRLTDLNNPRIDQQREPLYVDIGVYGPTCKPGYSMEAVTRKFEKYTLENRGFQGLYTDSFLTREEFNKMFDMNHYHQIRKKLKCEEAFPEAYDKISRAAFY